MRPIATIRSRNSSNRACTRCPTTGSARPGPRSRRDCARCAAAVDAGSAEVESLFEAMLAQQPDVATGHAGDHGDDLPWPASSGPFISGQAFGTRATTLMWRDHAQRTRIEERRFGPLGRPDGRTCIALAAGAGA